MKKILSILLILTILIMPGCRKKGDEQAKVTDKETQTVAVLHTTLGDISIKLHTNETPMTTNNFIQLSERDFYDDTIFHRVIKGFMIQGGDPTGTGSGGPGYVFPDEKFSGEYTRGTVAMANKGPNTNGSQFFIMHKTYPLQKNYVIFGEVIEGMSVVDAIAEGKVKENKFGEKSSPADPVKIESVDIITN